MLRPVAMPRGVRLGGYSLRRCCRSVPADSLSSALRISHRTGAHLTAPFDADLQTQTATLMFADVVDSVRLIEQAETANVIRIRALLRSLAQEVIPRHLGTVLERRGDGLLVRFSDARSAAACALDLHAQAAEVNIGHDAADVVALRIGVHSAEVIVDDSAIYGRGINLTARVTALAGPGQTVISAAVRDQLTDSLDGELRDLGECFLKNVADPVRAYQLHLATGVHTASAATTTTTTTSATAPTLQQALAPDESTMPLGVTLAVLPLTSAGTAPAAPGGADVFVDQLTAALSQSPVLRVISMLSANAFRGRRIVPARAGDRLAAHYVLGGHCDERNTQLTVHLELVHCGSGHAVWEQAFVCSHSDVLSTDSDVVARAVSAVVGALTHTELTVAHGRPLPNLAAHTLYLSAVTLLHRFSRTDFDRARLMLETLRDRAPRHAAPAAWLARWHVFKVVQGWSSDVRRDGAQASDFAQRALDHDPNSSLALAMAGSVQAGVQRDMSAAARYYDLALASNPNEPLAWLLKGVAHGFMGDARAALDSSERSLQLSPLDPLRFYYDSLSASAALGAQAYPRSIELAQRAIRANRMHGSAYRALAIAQVMAGAVDEARQTVTRLLGVEPHSSVSQFTARAAVDNDQNRVFAQALAAAGLPMG